MGGERGLCRRKSWQAGRVGQSYLWEGACSSFLASTTAWSLLGGTFPRRAWRDELAGGEQGLVPVSSPDRIIGGAAAALDVAGLMLSPAVTRKECTTVGSLPTALLCCVGCLFVALGPSEFSAPTERDSGG